MGVAKVKTEKNQDGTFSKNGRNIVTIFTDASFCLKSKVSGYGVWAKSRGESITGSGHYIGTPSVNIAELMATMAGIKLALMRGIAQPGDYIVLKTDSAHCVNFLNGDLEFNCVVHAQVLISLENVLKKYDLQFEAQHVKGHSKNSHPRFWVNNKCDALAKEQLVIARAHVGFSKKKKRRTKV